MAAEPGLTTFELLTIIGAVAMGSGGIVAAVFTGSYAIRREFWRGNAKIVSWQNKHERRDERRFTIMDNRITEILLRNYNKDGHKAPQIVPVNDLVEAMEEGDNNDAEEND